MELTTNIQERLCSDQTVTIFAATQTSTAAFLNGTSLVAIDIPVDFVGTAMTFKVSTDGVTYRDYKRMIDGLTVTSVVGANAAYAAGSHDFAGYNYIKLVAGSLQTETILITLQTRPL